MIMIENPLAIIKAIPGPNPDRCGLGSATSLAVTGCGRECGLPYATLCIYMYTLHEAGKQEAGSRKQEGLLLRLNALWPVSIERVSLSSPPLPCISMHRSRRAVWRTCQLG